MSESWQYVNPDGHLCICVFNEITKDFESFILKKAPKDYKERWKD